MARPNCTPACSLINYCLEHTLADHNLSRISPKCAAFCVLALAAESCSRSPSAFLQLQHGLLGATTRLGSGEVSGNDAECRTAYAKVPREGN